MQEKYCTIFSPYLQSSNISDIHLVMNGWISTHQSLADPEKNRKNLYFDKDFKLAIHYSIWYICTKNTE